MLYDLSVQTTSKPLATESQFHIPNIIMGEMEPLL